MDRGSERPAAHTQQKLTQLPPPPPPLSKRTTQIWVVTHHQYGIPALVNKPGVLGLPQKEATNNLLIDPKMVVILLNGCNCHSTIPVP